MHRWARLLKQQSSITIYRLSTKENKLPFSVSIFRKEMEVYHFRFPFAANKWKLPFSVSSVFLFAKFRKYGDGDMEGM
jgi:hypothetical protein